MPNRIGANIGKRVMPRSAVADSQEVDWKNFVERCSSGRISEGMSEYFSTTVMKPKSDVSMNTKEGSLLVSELLPRITEASLRAFLTMVGMIR